MYVCICIDDHRLLHLPLSQIQGFLGRWCLLLHVPHHWPELTGTWLSQPVSWGPLVILTLDRNSPSKYTAGTMRTWDVGCSQFFCEEGMALRPALLIHAGLLSLSREMQILKLCLTLLPPLSLQGHRLESRHDGFKICTLSVVLLYLFLKQFWVLWKVNSSVIHHVAARRLC